MSVDLALAMCDHYLYVYFMFALVSLVFLVILQIFYGILFY